MCFNQYMRNKYGKLPLPEIVLYLSWKALSIWLDSGGISEKKNACVNWSKFLKKRTINLHPVYY